MELITPRLVLREFRASDFSALRELEALPETYRYEEANPSEEKTRLQLEQILAHIEDSPRKVYRLAITIPPRDVVMGRTSFVYAILKRDWKIKN